MWKGWTWSHKDFFLWYISINIYVPHTVSINCCFQFLFGRRFVPKRSWKQWFMHIFGGRQSVSWEQWKKSIHKAICNSYRSRRQLRLWPWHPFVNFTSKPSLILRQIWMIYTYHPKCKHHLDPGDLNKHQKKASISSWGCPMGLKKKKRTKV